MSDTIKIKGSQVAVALEGALALVKTFATTPEQTSKLDELTSAVRKIDKRKSYALNKDFLATCKNSISDYITVGYKTQSPDVFLNELLTNVGGVEYEPGQSSDDGGQGGGSTSLNDRGQGGVDQDGNEPERDTDTSEDSSSNGGGNLPKDDSAFSDNSRSSKDNPSKLEQLYNKGKEFVDNNKKWFIGGAAAVATGASVLGIYGLKKTSHPALKSVSGISDSSDFDKLISSLKGDVAMNCKAGDVLTSHLNVNTVNGNAVNEDGTRDNMRYNLVYIDTVGENFSETLRFRYNNDAVNVIVGYSVHDQLWINLSN